MAVKFTITADGKKAEAALRKVAKEVDGLGKVTKTTGKETEKLGKKTTTATKGMSTGWLKVGAAMAGITIIGHRLVRFFGNAAEAAGEQQAATERLRQSLANVGESWDVHGERLQEAATDLQKLTGAADEQTLASMALGVSLGVPVEKLGDYSMALANAEAAGLPMETLQRGLSASFEGSATALGRYLPAVRSLTEEQLRAGGALDLINERFGDLAKSQSTTWLGAVNRLKGAWGDLVEEGFGRIITDSPVVRATMIELALEMLDLANDTTDATEAMSGAVGEFAKGAIDVLEALVKSFNFVSRGWVALQNTIVAHEKASNEVRRAQLEDALSMNKGFLAAKQEELEQTDRTTARYQKLLEQMGPYHDTINLLTGQIAELTDEITDESRELATLQGDFSALQGTLDNTTDRFIGIRERIAATAAAIGQRGQPGTLAGNLGEAGAAAKDIGQETDSAASRLSKFTGEDDGKLGSVFAADDTGLGDLESGFTATADSVTTDINRMGEAFGTFIGQLATADDKQEALKTGAKSMAIAAVQAIGQVLTAQLSATAASSAANITASAAQTAAATPAAIVTSIGDRGANVGIAAAALAAGVAGMTAIIGAIGDRGIDAIPGGGRMTVNKRGDELLLDPVGTTKFHANMDAMDNLIRNAGGGVLAGMRGGTQQQAVQTNVTVNMDGRTIAEIVDVQMAQLARFGRSEFSQAALVTP
jgi:hypothetical protein